MNSFATTATCFFVVSMALTVIGAPLNSNDQVAVTGSRTAMDCPRIVSRKEWGARNCSSPYSPMVTSPAPYVVAHHGGIPHYCYDEKTCAKIVRGYQDFHMDTHGWIDVGYHFIIGGDGNVYEGRGWDHVGAHAPGYNGQGIGICIIGDYTSHMPDDASLNAFKSLIECGISLGKVTPDYKLIGHRQGRATECPGQIFYDYLKTMSHWEEHPTPARVTTFSSVVRTNAVKVASPTVDITGTKLWNDLISLGVPEGRTLTVASATTNGQDEENVVDTGRTKVKNPSN